MANARAYRQLQAHEDGMLTFSGIERFRGFASGWMKTQPKGYQDYDRWCRNTKTMNKGRAALTTRIHEISPNPYRRLVDAKVLRPFENADYSWVPVVRVPDSRIPWLNSGRLFPKSHGVQVVVHTHEHPPPHFHAEFLNSNKVVRVAWPSLTPLRGSLSKREEKYLRSYLAEFHDEIHQKLQNVYGADLQRAMQ
jgi:hypothetical protein